MNIKISVIVPCYNVNEELFFHCLNSITAQSFRELEIILVNDGSAEEYCHALRKAAEADERVRLINKQNQGVSAARNTGAAEARGDYIVFADADDLLMPDFLSEAYETAVSSGADFVIGGNILLHLYDSKAPVGKLESDMLHIYTGSEKLKLRKYMLGKLLRFGSSGYFGRGPWTRLVKRELVQAVPFDRELAIGEDILWNLQLLNKCSRVCMADRIWYGYYTGGTSATRGYNKNAVSGAELELKKFRAELDMNSDDDYRAYCERMLEDLKRIYDCYLSQEKCPLKKKEKKALIRRLYTDELWQPLKEKRFYSIADKNSRLKCFLYEHKGLFRFFRLMQLVKK